MGKAKMVRAISRDGSAFVHVCDSTEIVAEARRIHNTSKTMTAALGRALTACSLMGAQLKGEKNSLTLQFKVDGPSGDIVCVSDYRGNVKGYALYPDAELPPNSRGKLDVGGALGQGNLHVIKDLGMNEPYIGMCPLKNGEIAEDITEYFVRSEQVPTACALGVHVNKDLTVKSAGGMLLQLLPFADDEVAAKLEENLSSITSISQMIADGVTVMELIETIFAGIEFDVLDESDIAYRCNCSRERYASILAILNERDMRSLIDEGKDVETVCNFCGEKYIFPVSELEAMLAARKSSADQ